MALCCKSLHSPCLKQSVAHLWRLPTFRQRRFQLRIRCFRQGSQYGTTREVSQMRRMRLDTGRRLQRMRKKDITDSSNDPYYAQYFADLNVYANIASIYWAAKPGSLSESFAYDMLEEDAGGIPPVSSTKQWKLIGDQ